MGPSRQVEGMELVLPNKFKAIQTAGLHVVMCEAFALQRWHQEAAVRQSPVPLHVAEAILHSIPSSLIEEYPLSHMVALAVPMDHLSLPEAGHLSDNLLATSQAIRDWTDNVPLEMGDPEREKSHLNAGTQLGMSYTEAVLLACDIHIEWDEMGDTLVYSAPTEEVVALICTQLNWVLSEGKDCLVKAVSDNSVEDATAIVEVAEQMICMGSEGYSCYESFEAFTMLSDVWLGLEDIQVANVVTVTSAILCAGPGEQEDIAKGKWPLLLNKDSWFHFLISVLVGAARAGGWYNDIAARGNFPLNVTDANFDLENNFEVLASQMEMVKWLLEQLYAQFDERQDMSALAEWAKEIQDKALDSFEWLLWACIGVKCLFLSNYFPEGDLKEIMERILLKFPCEEITDFMQMMWKHQIEANTKAESVMTMIRDISCFIYSLPFLFSLYHHPEPSRTFYDNPHATDMM